MISGENRQFTLIRCTDNAEWLQQRTNGVGGSDVAAIMGLSPWRTPMQVWLEKTGREQPQDISDKPYVAFGNTMEPVVGKWYAEQFPTFTVRRVNAICQSISRPWAQASLDYEVNDGRHWGVLEIKTARTAQDWQDGVPAYYLTQVTHYLSVTGRAFAYVAVFFRDTCEFKAFYIERDEEDIAAVDSAVDTFWHDYVEAGIMPQLTGTAGEVASLTDYYGKPANTFTHLHDASPEAVEARQAIAEYLDAARAEKQAKEAKTKATATLAKLIGDAKGLDTDVARVTWVRREATKLDTKRLQAEHPEIWEQYAYRQVQNGGLRIKEL